MKRENILLVGSILTERQFFTDTIPQANQLAYAEDFTTTVSSKVINAGRILAARHSVSMLGTIGNDRDGQQAINSIKHYHISPDLLRTHSTLPTGQIYITTNNKGESALTLFLGAATGINIPNLSILKSFTHAYLETSFNLHTLYQLLDLLQRQNITILLDVPNQQDQIDLTQLKPVNFLIPNRQEAEALLGQSINSIDSALKAAAQLIKFISGTVIITLDVDGCVVCHDKPYHLPAPSVTPIDTTASGDIFRAVFFDHFISTQDISASAQKAVQVATSSTTIKSVDASINQVINKIE